MDSFEKRKKYFAENTDIYEMYKGINYVSDDQNEEYFM